MMKDDIVTYNIYNIDIIISNKGIYPHTHPIITPLVPTIFSTCCDGNEKNIMVGCLNYCCRGYTSREQLVIITTTLCCSATVNHFGRRTVSET